MVGFLFFLQKFLQKSFSYLLGTSGKEEVEDLLNAIMVATPRVRWHVQCYHYEKKNGIIIKENGETITYSTWERVNTRSETEFFRFTSWSSKPSIRIDISRTSLAKIRLMKKYSFKNALTKVEFQRQKNVFQQLNKHDTHQEFSESFEIPGFEDSILFEYRSIFTIWFLNLPYYLLTHLLLLSPLYRWWCSYMFVETSVEVLKILQYEKDNHYYPV